MFTWAVYGVLVHFPHQVPISLLDPVPLNTLFEIFSAYPDVTVFMPTTTAGMIEVVAADNGAPQWTGSASTLNEMLGSLHFWPQMSSSGHTAVLSLQMRSRGIQRCLHMHDLVWGTCGSLDLYTAMQRKCIKQCVNGPSREIH